MSMTTPAGSMIDRTAAAGPKSEVGAAARSRPLRILLVNLVDWDQPTGSCQHQLGLMDSWLARGHDVRMLTPASGAMSAMPERHRGRVSRTVSLGRRLGLPLSVDTLSQLVALVWLRIVWRPDIVYSRTNSLTFLLAGLARALGLRIVIEHNGWLSRERLEGGGSARLAHLEERAQVLAARLAHRSRCVTRGIADRLADLGVDGTRLFALGNGCDTASFGPLDRDEAFRAIGLPPERTTVGFIGNIVPWHGLDIALEAFATVAARHPDTDFVVFGDGPARAGLEADAARLGIADRVRFLGRVPAPRANLAINCLDVAVLPLTLKRDTAFGYSPIKIRDYAAAGRLVLTGHLPDSTELVGRGWLHTHVADDAADMARVLDRLLAVRASWPAAGRAARRFAEEHFDWRVIAGRIDEELHRVAG
ncbi:MAG: glycosyltransferase [Hyphomicrobiaceae bacterium]